MIERKRNPGLRLPNSGSSSSGDPEGGSGGSPSGRTALYSKYRLHSTSLQFQQRRVSFSSEAKHYSPHKKTGSPKATRTQRHDFREINFDIVIIFGNVGRGIGNSGRVRRFDVSFFLHDHQQKPHGSYRASRIIGGTLVVELTCPLLRRTQFPLDWARAQPSLPSASPTPTPTRTLPLSEVALTIPSLGLPLASHLSQLTLHGKHD